MLTINATFGAKKVLSILSDPTLLCKISLSPERAFNQIPVLLRWAPPIVDIFRPVRGYFESILHDITLTIANQHSALFINPETWVNHNYTSILNLMEDPFENWNFVNETFPMSWQLSNKYYSKQHALFGLVEARWGYASSCLTALLAKYLRAGEIL